MFVQLSLVHSELYLFKTREIVCGALFRLNCIAFERVKNGKYKTSISLANNTASTYAFKITIKTLSKL